MSDHPSPDPSDRRRRGQEMMKEVYGWDIGDVAGDFVEQTVDHLFGRVWAEGTLSVRERRLVLLGMLAGTGQHDVIGLQVDCALQLGEITPDELRELVVFVAHYAGWPQGAKMNQTVEDCIARHQRSAEGGDG